MMFGLQRKSNKEKPQRNSNSQTPFKYSLNNFDEFVSVQDRPNRRSNEPFKSSQGEADPKRRFLQFDVQEICDNFEKGMMKALKDISKSPKKSTSTRAPVAEPSLFISKKTQDCDLPSLETEFNLDNEQAIVELTVLQPELPSSLVLSPQVFEEEPLDFPHQCPCLDTRICLDDDLGPIFDEEDEPCPVFDEEATSITSIAMENYLCFDPGTTPAPLPPDLQEHCEKSELVISLPDMFDKISSLDVIRFGLDKIKENCFSKSVFGNMINSFKIFEPDKFLDQQRFQNNLGISSEIILSFDQSLEQSKVFDHFEKYLELDMKQTDFCATKSFDSFVFKENSFDLNSSRHRLITDDSFASSLDLDDFLIKKMQEQNSLETETGFCELDFCDSNFLRSSCENFVDLSVADILVYNTFFEKCLESLIVVSQSEFKLVCSDVDNDMHVLEMINVVAYLDKILVCNVYFDLHLDRLKNVQFEIQVQPLIIESIARAQQSEFWRSFVVQTGYLGASNRGSVQEGYLNSPKLTCLMLAHVLDDYPKGLDPDFDVLRIEKPFDYFFGRFDVTDRTVPNASGWELWLEPWPDDRFHCTGLCLHRPVFHLMKNSRDGIAFGRTDPELGHCYTFLDSTTCTARMSSLRIHQYPCPDDRIHRTGARISRTDWHFKSNGRDRFGFGRLELKIGHDTSKLATLDCPACVLAQSAGHASGSNEPGRNLKGFSLVKVTFLSFLVRLSPSFDPSFVGPCHRSYHQFSILSDLSSYQPYRKSDPYFGSINIPCFKTRRRGPQSRRKIVIRPSTVAN
ncbi:hypothetical protein IGI04_019764 [Brassica rapa subsp. trilocularis]|uniref:Uncharacterized protein n=1 Tax=Brassica rapa subsp. trilocularis TaxID=1813537 RepID=A0ABQ7MGS4_BRACM|nr:hypothetical protein IGI04_019764 [Brassica rapa subsp. trilocularis]